LAPGVLLDGIGQIPEALFQNSLVFASIGMISPITVQNLLTVRRCAILCVTAIIFQLCFVKDIAGEIAPIVLITTATHIRNRIGINAAVQYDDCHHCEHESDESQFESHMIPEVVFGIIIPYYPCYGKDT